MNVELRCKMDDAWSYIWSGLYCEKTRLFYDYRTSREPEHQFDCLPTPDEIAVQYPNPAGWGTGMEDSMLNAGSVLEVLCLRKELEKEPSALFLAADVLDGMMQCAYSHGVDGFLVRSLCPADGRSCYFNSSRDQFTLAVYGAWRFLNAFPDVPKPVRTTVQGLLENIAKYCESVIVADNDNLLRLDGHQALVSSMVQVAAHELLRLPMFYAAAWSATKDDHWLELCRKYARPGIEGTLRMDRDRQWWDWELCQMQLSLALLRDVEPEPDLKREYARAMLITAELAGREMRKKLTSAASFNGEWDVMNADWRNMKMVVRPETLDAGGQPMLYGGYKYLMPQFPEAFNVPYGLLRAIGNLAYTAFMCREYNPSPDLIDGFAQTAMKPEYRNHGSDGPINMLHGYWVGRSRGLF